MLAINLLKLIHVIRAQAVVAHESSQHARRVNSTAVWLVVELECIDQTVVKDHDTFMG